MYSKKIRKTYKNKNVYENKKSSDSVLKFLIARLQWIGMFGAYIQWPKNSKMNAYCCFFETFR